MNPERTGPSSPKTTLQAIHSTTAIAAGDKPGSKPQSPTTPIAATASAATTEPTARTRAGSRRRSPSRMTTRTSALPPIIATDETA